MGLILVLIASLAMLVAPIVLDIVGHPIGFMATAALMGIGGLFFLASTALLAYAHFYVKAKPNEALIRSGKGGLKVVVNGGCFYVSFLHDLARIPLETLRFTMQQTGANGLLTKDKLRADLHVEFFVRVDATEEGIVKAASTIGAKLHDATELRGLIENKLVDLLRDSAAGKTLDELITNRKDLTDTIKKAVVEVFAHNGLMFEGLAITKIDQADTKTLDPNNVNDAIGLKNAAIITQKAMTERNEAEQEGERARTEKNVQTHQQILAMKQTESQAVAEQAARVLEIQAEQDRLAKEKQIGTVRAVELATVEQQQAIEVAKRQKQQAEVVADQAKLKAETEAKQQVEVALRAAEEAVANAEAKRALAEAEKAKAQALLETEKQAITTVEVVATAERQKKQQVIAAQADADRALITAKNTAEAQAFAVERNASARKTAADADAEATRKAAEAQRDAKKAEAEGTKALAMVPVEVLKETAVANDAQVNVDLKKLQGQQEYGKAGLEFQLSLKRVEVDGDVRKEAAKAMASVVGQINATVVSTPAQVGEMLEKFNAGMGLSRSVEGFLEGLSPEMRAVVEGAGGQFANVLGAVAKKLGISPKEIAAGGQMVDASKGRAPRGSDDADGSNGDNA